MKLRELLTKAIGLQEKINEIGYRRRVAKSELSQIEASITAPELSVSQAEVVIEKKAALDSVDSDEKKFKSELEEIKEEIKPFLKTAAKPVYLDRKGLNGEPVKTLFDLDIKGSVHFHNL